jgi:hypothetical protein
MLWPLYVLHSGDGGHTVANASPEFSDKVAMAAGVLNLKAHSVGRTKYASMFPFSVLHGADPHVMARIVGKWSSIWLAMWRDTWAPMGDSTFSIQHECFRLTCPSQGTMRLSFLTSPHALRPTELRSSLCVRACVRAGQCPMRSLVPTTASRTREAEHGASLQRCL